MFSCFCQLKPNVIEEVAVAFANSEGGEIIIGIEDKKVDGQNPLARWSGHISIEDYNEVIHALGRLDPVIDFDGFVAQRFEMQSAPN
jgi:ATP-dependent DNA helicase RecG